MDFFCPWSAAAWPRSRAAASAPQRWAQAADRACSSRSSFFIVRAASIASLRPSSNNLFSASFSDASRVRLLSSPARWRAASRARFTSFWALPASFVALASAARHSSSACAASLEFAASTVAAAWAACAA